MRWFLAVAVLASQAWAQALPGSETVILRVDGESIYAHLFKSEATGRRPAMVLVHGFELASRLVSCGEYLEFVMDGGYSRPELWLADGWARVQRSDSFGVGSRLGPASRQARTMARASLRPTSCAPAAGCAFWS